jgi:hypothetical protein
MTRGRIGDALSWKPQDPYGSAQIAWADSVPSEAVRGAPPITLGKRTACGGGLPQPVWGCKPGEPRRSLRQRVAPLGRKACGPRAGPIKPSRLCSEPPAAANGAGQDHKRQVHGYSLVHDVWTRTARPSSAGRDGAARSVRAVPIVLAPSRPVLMRHLRLPETRNHTLALKATPDRGHTLGRIDVA